MITIIHLLAGAVVGHVLGNIYAAAIFSFVTHYLLDAVPHWSWKPLKNYKDGGWKNADKLDFFIKAIDPVVGIGLCLYFLYHIPVNLVPSVVVGIIFGWLPDLMVFLEWKFGIAMPLFIRKFENKFHQHEYSFSGIIPQIIVGVLCLYYLINIAL
ncbi:MAG: hypothetical protein AAB340_02250 [Patescibacteria group bacterium]